MIFNRIQRRCASVLALLPPAPSASSILHQTQQQKQIVTPASLPLTAVSNNPFNPNYIPEKTKQRLALDDLHKVLDNSKSMFKVIQSKYISENCNSQIEFADEKADSTLEELLEEQYKMIQLLKANSTKKKE